MYASADLEYILLRASEAGSPTNRLGSGQQRDTDKGLFSLSTGGLVLTYNLKIRANIRPILLRQGEPWHAIIYYRTITVEWLKFSFTYGTDILDKNDAAKVRTNPKYVVHVLHEF